MGDVAFGRNKTFGYLVEGTAGAYVASAYNQVWGSPTLKGLYLLESEFVPNIEIMKEPHMSGKSEITNLDFAQGIQNYTVRVKMKLPKEGLGWLLFGLFGKVVTTGAASPYMHVFTPSVNSPYPVSFKLQIREPLNATEIQWQLRGAKVKSMAFDFATNKMPTVTIEFVGASFEKAAALDSAPIILVPASGNPFWVNTERTASEPNFNGEVVDFNSLSFKIENMLAEDLDDSYNIASAQRSRLERAGSEECIKFSGTIKRVLPNTNIYGWWKDLTTINFGDEFQVSPTYQFTPSSYAKIIKVSRTPRGMGLIEETTEFEGLYNISMNVSFQIITKDTQATPATEGS